MRVRDLGAMVMQQPFGFEPDLIRAILRTAPRLPEMIRTFSDKIMTEILRATVTDTPYLLSLQGLPPRVQMSR
jgi:hypothetical protein